MYRSTLGIIGVCIALSGCYTPTLVSEDRNGKVVYYRSKLYERTYSDQTAKTYCLQYQKPSTWVSTDMTKGGNYLDEYKCGAIPPATMSIGKKREAYQPVYHDENRPIQSKEQNREETISGDYFGSRSRTKDSNW